MDLDVASRGVDINAAVVMPQALAIANDNVGVWVIDTARYAGTVVTDLTAYPFGIRGVREHKP